MRKLLLQPQARLDLLEIWHHIADHSPRIASKVIEKIELAIWNLVEMPGIGHRRADVKDRRYRFWSVYRFIIAYRYDATSLTVVRVVQGSRDFRKLFRR